MDYLLRTLRNIGPMFDYDYERMIIALSVTMANTRHIVESPGALEPYLDLATQIPVEQQRPMTRLEIARATGLPRETVRRKVARLIDAGILVKDERGGVRLTSGVLTAPPMLSVVTENEANVRRLFHLIRPLIEAEGAGA